MSFDEELSKALSKPKSSFTSFCDLCPQQPDIHGCLACHLEEVHDKEIEIHGTSCNRWWEYDHLW